MKKLLAIFFLFATSAGAATISGTVSNNGAPLAEMTVAAYTTAGTLQTTATTDASGLYTLTLPAGDYHVLAFDPAGVFATSFYNNEESFETSATLSVSASQNLGNINFVLPRAAFIVGHVTAPSGTALANITIAVYNLSGTRRGFTKTDANGDYTLALPPGSYKIAAYDEALHYATTFFGNASSFDAAAIVTIQGTNSSTANLTLPVAATVSGTVFDRTSGARLGGIRVTAYAEDGNIGAVAFTGNDGRYAFAVRPGSIRVVLDDPAGTYATYFVPDVESFSVQPPIAVTAGATTTIDATLLRAAHIVGRVTALSSGLPLPGITAAAYNESGTLRSFATTDANGVYAIVVPPGDYYVAVYDDARVYVTEVHPSVAHAVTIVTGFDFTLTKTVQITGTATHAVSGAKLPGITIAAYDLDGNLLESTTTNSSGHYAMMRAAGTFKLLAYDSALQYATTYYGGAVSFGASQPLSPVEGSSLTADFALRPAGRLRGTVIDAASAPLANMQVIAYDGAGNAVAETTTLANGTFRLPLAAGTYSIAAANIAADYAVAYAQPVTIQVGQETGPIQIRLVPPQPSHRRRAARH